MLYGISTNSWVTYIGAIYILKDFDEELYRVLEGNADFVRKDTITLIKKEEYDFLRAVQNEMLENKDMFSENTQEYITNLYQLRNVYNEESPVEQEMASNLMWLIVKYFKLDEESALKYASEGLITVEGHIVNENDLYQPSKYKNEEGRFLIKFEFPNGLIEKRHFSSRSK